MIRASDARRAASLLLPLLAGAACSDRTRSPAPQASAPASLAPAVPAVRELAAVTSRPLGATETLQGELLPYRAVDVFARVPGYVKAVRVDRGSRVRQGDVLVELEAPELLQQRTEAEARLSASQQTAERLRQAAATAGGLGGHGTGGQRCCHEV